MLEALVKIGPLFIAISARRMNNHKGGIGVPPSGGCPGIAAGRPGMGGPCTGESCTGVAGCAVNPLLTLVLDARPQGAAGSCW